MTTWTAGMWKLVKNMPYSGHCKNQQHWACRGVKGRGRVARNKATCECPCHNKPAAA